MNCIKKSVAVALTALTCLAGYAEAMYLHIQTPEGWKVLDLEKVDRLTFAGGVMTASDKENKPVATFPQETLKTMVVNDSQTSGVSAVEAGAEAVFTYDAASRVVTFLADGPLSIYGADGVELHTIEAVAKGETVSLEGLRSGVIILKSGDYSLKTVVK